MFRVSLVDSRGVLDTFVPYLGILDFVFVEVVSGCAKAHVAVQTFPAKLLFERR